mgnify:CR=1 FL=1
MLEVLLFQYKDMFGEDFPLEEFADKREIDVINILYDCVSNNVIYDSGRPVRRVISDAPGMKL